MILWSYDRMTIWSYNRMIIWSYDHMIIWSYDCMIIRSYDHMTIWSYDHMIRADLYFASLSAACKGWSLLCIFVCRLQRLIFTLLLCLLLAMADLYFASLPASCKGWSLLCYSACCLQRLISALLLCPLLAEFCDLILYGHTHLAWLNEPLQVTQTLTMIGSLAFHCSLVGDR